MKSPKTAVFFAVSLLTRLTFAADAPAPAATAAAPAAAAATAPTYDATIATPLTDGQVIELFPEGVPGWKDIGPEVVTGGTFSNISNPRMIVGLPKNGVPQNGTAIIFCAGGGYVHVAGPTGMNGQFNPLGVTMFNLIYRCAEFGAPAPQQDIMRAIRLVRAHAKEFGIDPNKIGVMGDSAGSHVAGSGAILFDDPVGKTGNALDSVSARPDFGILLFSVLTMEAPYAHGPSKENLIGKNPTQEMIDQYSLEKHVTRNTTPLFLVHTQQDNTVKEENELMLYTALRKNNVPSELHLYAIGGHGSGLGPSYGTSNLWPKLAEEWMRYNGWLPPSDTSLMPAARGGRGGAGAGGRGGAGAGARGGRRGGAAAAPAASGSTEQAAAPASAPAATN